MSVHFHQIDFDGDAERDLAFFSGNEIGLTDLLAGFG